MMLRNGNMYMASFGDLDNPVLGVSVHRMWLKPWMWELRPVYYTHPGAVLPPGAISETGEGEPIKNLTMLEAVGMMKLMGVTHRDFGNFLGEPR